MAAKRASLFSGLEYGASIPPSPFTANGDRIALSLLETESQKTRTEHFAKLSPKIGEIVDAWRAEKRKLLPAKAWEQRSQLIGRRRAEAHELPVSGSFLSASEAMAFRRDTRQQSSKLFAKIDHDRLKKIREEHTRELRRLVHGQAAELPRVEVLAEEEVPAVIRNRAHNPPFTVVPPYPYNFHTFFHYFRGGTSELTNEWTDASIGRVGHRSVYKNFDADDNDYCSAEAQSRIAFDVPAQGFAKKWKFTIKTRCSRARAQFTWWDESGSSYTDNLMYSNLRIAISTEPSTNLLHHPFERAQIWKQWWHGDDDFDKFYEFKPPGTERWFTWTTDFNLPNKPASVSVGTADYVDHHLDDVSVQNIMNNRWLIEQVSIELV